MAQLPTEGVALDEYMGSWFRGEVPEMVELRSMAVRFRTQVSERILRRRHVIDHLENVKSCPTCGCRSQDRRGCGVYGLLKVSLVFSFGCLLSCFIFFVHSKVSSCGSLLKSVFQADSFGKLLGSPPFSVFVGSGVLGGVDCNSLVSLVSPSMTSGWLLAVVDNA
ncbi:hypothetical protein Tco_1432613 [Tanacetum coccineum]